MLINYETCNALLRISNNRYKLYAVILKPKTITMCPPCVCLRHSALHQHALVGRLNWIGPHAPYTTSHQLLRISACFVFPSAIEYRRVLDTLSQCKTLCTIACVLCIRLELQCQRQIYFTRIDNPATCTDLFLLVSDCKQVTCCGCGTDSTCNTIP